MALNLKEKAEFARLQAEVRIARALRWSEPVARDLPAPRLSGNVSQGWDYNIHTCKVEPAWSSSIYHGWGEYIRGESPRSQYSFALYSTELLALRALRCELERKAAEALAAIDARIEKLVSDS
jgi:hypothetical protein